MADFFEDLGQAIAEINSKVYDIVGGVPLVVLLFLVGIFMTVGTRFFQVTKLGYTMKKTLFAVFSDRKVTKTNDKRAISQFQALSTALAATVGSGNIVGVATAIAAGGAGAVFWMWLSAFFGMMTNFSENVLGIYYRDKNEKGEWVGGAMYYLEKGVHAKWLGVIFSIFCLLASFGIGNLVQVNNISSNVANSFHVPLWITGVICALFVGFVIIGGIKRIASVTEKLVPFMAIVYIVGALVVVFANIKGVPGAFREIFTEAFSFQSVGGGILGYTIARAIRFGVARGVFSNEAGLGSSVMVHSASDVKEPVMQGIWGIFEVFFDTIVICTLTALAILTTGVHHTEGLEANNFTSAAFSSVFGAAGGYIVTVCLMLFALSTILGWSIYGSRAIEYLFGNRGVIIYKVIFVLLLVVGAVQPMSLVWDLADTFNSLMAIPNLIGVLLLSGTVFQITKNYKDRYFKGLDVQPMLSYRDNDKK